MDNDKRASVGFLDRWLVKKNDSGTKDTTQRPSSSIPTPSSPSQPPSLPSLPSASSSSASKGSPASKNKTPATPPSSLKGGRQIRKRAAIESDDDEGSQGAPGSSVFESHLSSSSTGPLRKRSRLVDQKEEGEATPAAPTGRSVGRGGHNSSSNSKPEGNVKGDDELNNRNESKKRRVLVKGERSEAQDSKEAFRNSFSQLSESVPPNNAIEKGKQTESKTVLNDDIKVTTNGDIGSSSNANRANNSSSSSSSGIVKGASPKRVVSAKKAPIAKSPSSSKQSGSSPTSPIKKQSSSPSKASSSKAPQTPGLTLEGKKVVVTGVFENCSREEIEQSVKRFGGQVMSAVSGRTDFLIIGSHIESREGAVSAITEGSKYKKATELIRTKKGVVRIITESEFEELIRVPSPRSSPRSASNLISPAPADSRLNISPSTKGGISSISSSHKSPTRLYTPSTGLPSTTGIHSYDNRDDGSSNNDSYNDDDNDNNNDSKSLSPLGSYKGESGGYMGSSGSSGRRDEPIRTDEGRLWSEKYRPKTVNEILGNNELVKKLMIWLQDWEDVCIRGNLKPLPKSRGTGKFSEPERVNARAVLLSGPPGIGKTTAAKVVANQCGYEVLEFNASDSRGKNIVEIISDMTSGGMTLASLSRPSSSSSSKKGEVKPKRALLVMDEMDGLSAGDRGGGQATIKLIEKTRCPVICICNDRMNTKVRSIAAKCYDLKFHKPQKQTIVKRVCEIAKKEGLNVEYNAAELLCESVGNDLRQILNTLQLLGRQDMLKSPSSSPRGTSGSGTGRVTYDNMKYEIGYGLKDSQVMMNPFDVCKKVLTSSESRKMSFNDRLDAFFVDYDILPLLVQENYISAYVPSTSKDDMKSIGTVCEAADSFTFADMLSYKIRKDGSWALLPEVAVFALMDQSVKCSGFLPRSEFPRWFGRNSTTTKNRRLLMELQLFLAPSTTTCPTAMRTSGYLDLLYESALKPLLTASNEGAEDVKDLVRDCMSVMDEYGINREHVVENMASLRLKQQDKVYEMLDSSTKRTLTTMYNASSHAIRMAPAIVVKKGRGGGGGAISSSGNATPQGEGCDAPDAEGTAPIKEEGGGLGDSQQDAENGDDDEGEDMFDKLIVKKKGKARPKQSSSKGSPKKRATPKATRGKKK